MNAIDGCPSLLRVTRILAVEDFGPYRQFVLSILTGRPELQVVGSVSNGLEAVEKALELKPDLILMDIGLPGLNGIEAARRIRELLPDSKILFITQESSTEIIQEAILLGASGYVFKSLASADLLTAVQAVLDGKKFFSDGAGRNGS